MRALAHGSTSISSGRTQAALENVSPNLSCFLPSSTRANMPSLRIERTQPSRKSEFALEGNLTRPTVTRFPFLSINAPLHTGRVGPPLKKPRSSEYLLCGVPPGLASSLRDLLLPPLPIAVGESLPHRDLCLLYATRDKLVPSPVWPSVQRVQHRRELVVRDGYAVGLCSRKDLVPVGLRDSHARNPIARHSLSVRAFASVPSFDTR